MSALVNGTCISVYTSETEATYDLFLEFTPTNATDQTAFSGQTLSRANVSNLLKVLDNVIDDSAHVCFVAFIESIIPSHFVVHVSIGASDTNQFNFIRTCLKIENHKVNLFNTLAALRVKITNAILYSPHFDRSERHYRDVNSLTNLRVAKYKLINNLDQSCWTQYRNTLVEHIAICPRITMKQSMFDQISLDKICIHDLEFCAESVNFKKDNDNFLVCAEVYMAKTQAWNSSAKLVCQSYNIEDTMFILAHVMTCLSVFCLLLVIIMDCTCESPRKIPRRNNLFVSMTLLAAQCITTFGIGQIQLEIGCKIIGAFIQYFWLSYIFWVNVCSIHMLQILQEVATGPFNEQTLTFKYACHCFLLPLFFVGVNIFYNWQFNDGDLGYGNKCLCYFSSLILEIVTFSGPIAIVALVNVVLMLVSSIKVHRIKSPYSYDDTRMEIMYTFKLSILTWLACIVGLLYRYTSFQPFIYILIALNLGLGIFMFVARFCSLRSFNRQSKESFSPSISTGLKPSSTTFSLSNSSLSSTRCDSIPTSFRVEGDY